MRLLTRIKSIVMMVIITVLSVSSVYASGRLNTVSSFTGIYCDNKEDIHLIFDAWASDGPLAAKGVLHERLGACAVGFSTLAFFREELGTALVQNYRGTWQNIVMYSISPTKKSKRIDYAIVWVPIDEKGAAK